MFVPAITHVYLYISVKQQTANWGGYAIFMRIKKIKESLSALMVCFVSALLGWTKLGQIC